MTRIVFLTAASGEGTRSAPFGAARVASALKADHGLAGRVQCDILEAFPAESASALAARALSLEPDIVGLSLYVWNRARLLEAARAIKAARPATLVVAGGPEVSGDPDSILRSGCVDLAVCGEGEAAMASIVLEFMEGRTNNGRVIRAAAPDLAALPSPWLDGTLDPGHYGGAPLELARGCPFRCAFCFESRGSRELRRFPPERTAAEISALAAAGVDEVFVLDPTFNADRKAMARAVALMRERGPSMRFYLELRAELLDREQVGLLSSIDCTVQVGLQSADPAVLALVDRRMDPALFARKMGLLDEAGITYGLDLIYGLPGDCYDGFMRSVDWALGLGPNHLDVFRLAVLPGTALAERAGGLGLEHDPDAPYPVRSVPGFPSVDLDRAERMAEALDLLYNKGRAVMWFRPVAKALGERPSALVEAWAAFMGAGTGADAVPPAGHAAIEGLQLAFLATRFKAAGGKRAPVAEAAEALVRTSGAWTRALADGERTELELAWHPEALLAYAPAGLRRFATEFPREAGSWSCAPGPEGPSFTARKRKTRS